jgi:hypothetical protein
MKRILDWIVVITMPVWCLSVVVHWLSGSPAGDGIWMAAIAFTVMAFIDGLAGLRGRGSKVAGGRPIPKG